MQEEYSLWAPITKMDASTRTIEGPISGPGDPDLDGQIVDLSWLRKAVVPWSKYGNIRQAHDPRKPVGKAMSVDLDTADGVPVVRAHISDDYAWKMVQDGVFSGFSVGIKNPTILRDPAAPKGRIVDGHLIEVSIVDHPCNINAKFAVCKSVDGGWQDCQSGELYADEDPSTSEKHASMDMNYTEHTHGELCHIHKFAGAEHTHCPMCGHDEAACECGQAAPQFAPGAQMGEAFKAASDFKKFETAGAIHPSSQPEMGGKPEQGPVVHHEYNKDAVFTFVSERLRSMADELDERTRSGWSPNATPYASTKRTGGAGRDGAGQKAGSDSDFDAGAPPKSDTVWHGTKSYNKEAEVESAPLTAEMIYKIACGAFHDELTSLLDGDLLTKNAAPDSAKAAFAEALTSAFAGSMSGFAERLAKVESMAAPAKGMANALPLLIEKNGVLNAAERNVVDADIQKGVQSLTDDAQLQLAAQFISQHIHHTA